MSSYDVPRGAARASAARETLALSLRIGLADFSLEAAPDDTIIDLLERLRGEGRAVPPYRHSCHHGSCGTCGAVIDGLPALMCLTRVADLALPRPRVPGGPAVEPERDAEGRIVVSLAPLPGLRVIAGLAVSPSALFSGIPADASYLAPVDAGERASLPLDPTLAERDGAPARGRVRLEACIECGLCAAACPVKAPWRGPAGLAAVNREREKRPERASAMLELAAAPDGVSPCERHLACSRACPQAVYPGKHIQLLRNALAGRGRDR